MKSKFIGCLIGQCLGDALGLPVEGTDGTTCRQYVKEHVNRWFRGEQPSPQEWSGQYTDDSQLARDLLTSLVQNGGWVPEDYAEKIRSIFCSGKVVGRGIACDTAAKNLNEGVNWKESGVAPPSAGNGTAMRAAPVGLFYAHRPDEMVRVAHEQGWITHHDSRCSAGSVAIAGAVSLVVTDKFKDSYDFVSRLADWMKTYDTDFASLLMKLPQWISLDPDQAVQVISAAGITDGIKTGWPGISPFVIPSVLWSLYAFLKHPTNYEEAISTAIAVGGDVDTTAAMTGAISGAHLGIKSLPDHLTTMLQDQGQWHYTDLVDLAESAHKATTE